MIVEVGLPGGGRMKQIGHPIRYSATQPEYRSAGVAAGTHTREILRELGYAESAIDAFETTGLFT
jgi:crotonobetainyl-CoA:carnitine CoA-transferase CaiB-like acyl-CoA transferase